MKKRLAPYFIVFVSAVSLTVAAFASVHTSSQQLWMPATSQATSAELGPMSRQIVGRHSKGLDGLLQSGNIYEVKNTNDSGADSLRDAITQANGHVGADTIVFNILGTGPFKIAPVTSLPEITSPVTIDGYTQPGSVANTSASTTNAVLKIEISGEATVGGGLIISAGNSVVRGLAINRWGGSGIELRTNGGNLVEGCFIGTDVAGTSGFAANGSFGISIMLGSSNNTIGGTTPATRNIISAGSSGIFLNNNPASSNIVIQGNLIGTDATGTVDLGNGNGMSLRDPINSTIGGTVGTTPGGSCTGAGNVISGNSTGINIQGATQGTNNKIQGNYIGLTPSGTEFSGSGSTGIFLVNLCPATLNPCQNLIGGTTPAERNIVTSSTSGISITNSERTQIKGNYIGTNSAGNVDLGGTSSGVTVGGSDNSIIGGTEAGAGNVISGWGVRGISTTTTLNLVIQGNLIGTDATGTSALGNSQEGIFAGGSSSLTIGGTNPAARNVISGNGFSGISVNGPTGTIIQGNLIGTAINGTSALGNGKYGVEINEDQVTVGGSAPGSANTIAFNAKDGIFVNTGTGNSFIGNFIHSNTELGIDLSLDGITANDTDDPDTGANNRQNFPVLSTAMTAAGVTSVTGTLNSTPSTQFTVEFFANNSCDPTGNGEGQIPIGSTVLTTDSGGDTPVMFSPSSQVSVGMFITATARNNANGDTSEFSACVLVTSPGVLQLSSATYSLNESGGNAVVTVTRTGGSAGAVSVNYTTSNGTATAGQDYTAASGTINFANGDSASKTFNIPITNDTDVESDETVNIAISSPTGGATLGTPNTAVLSIVDNDAPPTKSIQFSAASYSGGEGSRAIDITVTRTGDTSSPTGPFNVQITGGTVNQRSDVNAAVLHRNFNIPANASSLTFKILITDDGFVEPDETLVMTITTLPAGYTLGNPGTAVMTIIDNDTVPTTVIDQAGFFTEEQYSDFLTRLSDPSGLAFWTGEINSCGSNQSCIDVKRINVSAAFFLSIEFQQTGYLVYRAHQAAFNTGPLLHFDKFFGDTQEIGEGVVVLAPGWEALLEANKQKYFDNFVIRPEFLALYPLSMTPEEYVDALNAHTLDPLNPGAAGSLSQAERNDLVDQLRAGTNTRAQVLRQISEDSDFQTREFNRAFVLMQYFGYLRRNPNDAPDNNMDGYNFWLSKLNQFGGNFIEAEMVNAFLQSTEYRSRFGP